MAFGGGGNLRVVLKEQDGGGDGSEGSASCACYCTLEVERSGLAVEALDLSNSIKAFSKRQLIKHADAQRRVHPEPYNLIVNTKREGEKGWGVGGVMSLSLEPRTPVMKMNSFEKEMNGELVQWGRTHSGLENNTVQFGFFFSSL